MAVAGLRGTGSFNADERPKNYEGILLYLNPNTEAPLTAMTGAVNDRPTDDPEFKCFTKDLPNQRAVVSAAVNSTVTTITLQGTGSQLIFKTGHAAIIEGTEEVVWVTGTPSAKTITVERGKGSTAAAITTDAGIMILGSHHEEGVGVPAAISYDPVVVTNYAQIFRTSVNLTGTAMATRLRYADNPMQELQREALEIHSIEKEKQFLFGSGVEDTTGAQAERTTKSIRAFVTSNVTDFAGAVTIDGWETYLENVFENGTNEKMHFCGNRMLTVLNSLARNYAEINTNPRSDAFGMKVLTWVTPYGELVLKQHPLLSRNPTFNSWGFTIDMRRVYYRYLRSRNTRYLPNRQSPGDDAVKSEYLTECGLQVDFESYHAVAKNASAFSA